MTDQVQVQDVSDVVKVDGQELTFTLPPKPIVRHLDKLIEKARTCQVYIDPESPSKFKVVSSNSGKEYKVVVKTDGATCDCPWGYHKSTEDQRSVCAHTLAVYLFLLEMDGGQYRMSAWTDEERAKRQKKQRWYVGEGVYLTFARKPKKESK